MTILNEKYSKFLKMQKLNLPMDAIKHKMGLEGLTAEEQDFFFFEMVPKDRALSLETTCASSGQNLSTPNHQPALPTSPATPRPFLDELKTSRSLKCVDKNMPDKSSPNAIKKPSNKPVSLVDEMKNSLKFRREVISPQTAEPAKSDSCESTPTPTPLTSARTLQLPQLNQRLSPPTTTQFADEMTVTQSFNSQSSTKFSYNPVQTSTQAMSFSEELKAKGANFQTTATPIYLISKSIAAISNQHNSFASELKEKQSEKMQREAVPFVPPAKVPSLVLKNTPKTLEAELKLMHTEKSNEARAVTTSYVSTTATLRVAQSSAPIISHPVILTQPPLLLAVAPSASVSTPSTNLLGNELKLARLRRQGLDSSRTETLKLEEIKPETAPFKIDCSPINPIVRASSVHTKQIPSSVFSSQRSVITSAITNTITKSSAASPVSLRVCGTSVTTPRQEFAIKKPVPSETSPRQEVTTQKLASTVNTTRQEATNQKLGSNVTDSISTTVKYDTVVPSNKQAPTQKAPLSTPHQALAKLQASSIPKADTTPKPNGVKLIISGAPASGKGTYSEHIKNEYGVIHLSTGDMLRDAIRAQTALGLRAKEYVEGGKLVPDDVIIDLVLTRVKESDCVQKGWLLDGFPCTVAQAKALANAGVECDAFIRIDAPESLLLERVTGRRLDPVTGKIYHLKFSPPENEVIASRLNHRADDTEEKFKGRLKAYYDNLNSINNFYAEKVMLVKIESSKQTSEIIFKQIQAGLKIHLKSKASKVLAGLPVTEPGLVRSVSNILQAKETPTQGSIPVKKECNTISPVRTSSTGSFTNEGSARGSTAATCAIASNRSSFTTLVSVDSSKLTKALDTNCTKNVKSRQLPLSLKPPPSPTSTNRVSSASTYSFNSTPPPSNVTLSASNSAASNASQQPLSQRISQQLSGSMSIRTSQRLSQQQSLSSINHFLALEISAQADSLGQAEARPRVDSASIRREVNAVLVDMSAFHPTNTNISPIAPVSHTITSTAPPNTSIITTISRTTTLLATPIPSFSSNGSTTYMQVDKSGIRASLSNRASLSLIDAASSLYKVTRDSISAAKSIVNSSIPPLCVVEPIVAMLRSSQSFSKVNATMIKATRSEDQSISSPRAVAHTENIAVNPNEPVPLLEKFKKSRKHNKLGVIDSPNSPRQIYQQCSAQQRLTSTPQSIVTLSPRSPQSPREIHHVEKSLLKKPEGSTRYFFAPPAKQTSSHGHAETSQISPRYADPNHLIKEPKTPWKDFTKNFFGSLKSSALKNSVKHKNGSSGSAIDYNAIYSDGSIVEGELTAENSPVSPLSSYNGNRPFSPGSASPSSRSNKNFNSPVTRPTQDDLHHSNKSELQVQVSKSNTKSFFFSTLRLF